MDFEILADFEGGSLTGWREGPDGIELDVPSVQPSVQPWFYFLVSGVRGRRLTFRTPGLDVGQAPVAISYDRFHWIAPSDGTSADSFTHRFEQEDATVSLTPPYTPGMLYEFSLWARRSPHVRIDYLDHVYGVTGITISEFEQTEHKPAVWVTAGHFPLGAAASWVAEGIVRFLLSTDPAARRLRQSLCFHVFIVPDPKGAQEGEASAAQRLITDAIQEGHRTSNPVAALVSLQGQSFGHRSTINASAEGLGRFVPWYTVDADSTREDDWLLSLELGNGLDGDPVRRLRLQTAWFYPPELFGAQQPSGAQPFRKSQFDLIQEGELLCRALDAALHPDQASADPLALPALLAPRVERSEEGARVSVWLAAPTSSGQEMTLTLHGEDFACDLTPEAEATTTFQYTRYVAAIDASEVSKVQSITVERDGARREMPLAERRYRPSDLSLY